MKSALLPTIGFLGATLACSAPGPDVAATQAVLDSILAVHAELIMQENVEDVLEHYTEDAVVRANHADPLRGRAAIREFVEQFYAAVDIPALRYETEDLAVYGDSAWLIATYRMTIQPPEQPAQEERGSAFALWTRGEDGAWRIQDDILNSHVPMAAPGGQQP